MKHLTQNKENNCGQTCIAMLANKSIKDIEGIVGHDEAMDTKEVIPVFDSLEIPVEKRWVTKKWRRWIGKYFLPLNCMVFIEFKNKDIGHLVIRKKGKIFDPSGRKYYFFANRHRIKGYLRIKS